MINYNDPIYILVKIFENTHPDKKAQIDFVSDMKKNTNAYGETCWADDGNVYIQIDIETPMNGLIEVLAHELAHLAVGADAEHNKEWENEFRKLGERLNQAMELIGSRGISMNAAVSDVAPRGNILSKRSDK